MYRIDNAKYVKSPCSCCEHHNIKVARFVYKDNQPYGKYFGGFTPGHDDRTVHFLVGLAEKTKQGIDVVNNCFAMYSFLQSTESECEREQVIIGFSKQSPWCDIKEMGEILYAAEAETHTRAFEAFELISHVLTTDRPIVKFLDNLNAI